MRRTIWSAGLTTVLALACQSARADDVVNGDADIILCHGGGGGGGGGHGGGVGGGHGGVGVGGWGGHGGYGCGWGGRGCGWGGCGWGFGVGVGYGWGGYGWGGYYGYPDYGYGYGYGYPAYYPPDYGYGYGSPYAGPNNAAPAAGGQAGSYAYQPAGVVVPPLSTQQQQYSAFTSSPGVGVTYTQQAPRQLTTPAFWAPAPVMPVSAPPQVVPPAGFEYNGGPAHPVPMPGSERVLPQKTNPALKDVRLSAPPSITSKFSFSAYCEPAKPIPEIPAVNTLTQSTGR